MTEQPNHLNRAIELLVYAPIGAGLFLKDLAPGFVDVFVARARAEIDRRHDGVQQRVTSARSLGQVAIAFGLPVLRERMQQYVDEARRAAEPEDTAVPPAAPSAAPAPPVEARTAPEASRETSGWTTATTPGGWAPSTSPPSLPTRATAPRTAPRSDELPIPGYDALSASQVVERLAGLAPGELDAVHAYEAAHRQRRTILGKIEQLAG